MRRGFFRTRLEGMGECARVDMRAGDAAPYLERTMYELLGFEPAFATLPTQEEFLTAHNARLDVRTPPFSPALRLWQQLTPSES